MNQLHLLQLNKVVPVCCVIRLHVLLIQLCFFPRSAVLRQMFLSPMEEARTGTVEITDMDSKTLRKLLEFIYTGEVDGMEDVAEELLYAADKYEIMGLVSINCFTELGQYFFLHFAIV